MTSGTLHINIKKVTNLPPEVYTIYVRVHSGNSTVRTRILKDCPQEAVFNENLQLQVETKDNLYVEVFDILEESEDKSEEYAQEAHDLLATSEAVPMLTVVKDWCTGKYIWLDLNPVAARVAGPVKIHMGMVWDGETAQA